MQPATVPSAPRRTPFYLHIYFQVLVGIILGAMVGYFFPAAGSQFLPLADAFLKLIRMILAPVVFCTVVTGITQMGSLKEVGRVGLKSLLYFEIVTTFALFIGLLVVNVIQPGAHFPVPAAGPTTAESAMLSTNTTAAHQQTFSSFLMDIIPTSFAEAFVGGKMLQIIFIATLFGIALAFLPDRGRPLVSILEIVTQTLFVIVRFIMYLAPLAAFGAMAYVIGKYGLGTVASYGKLIACLYLTSSAFIFIVLGLIARWCGISFWKFLVYIKDEIVITFATASTETVYPRMLVKLERMGCDRSIVGLVLPAGYAFNADGGCIYLTMAAIFLAQATQTHMTLGDQVLLLLVCLFTSKGAAGVAGAGFVALAATLMSMNKIPAASLVLIFGVDRFLNEARAVTNLIGNGIATVAVARWERAIDLERANAVLAGHHAGAPAVTPATMPTLAEDTAEAPQ